MPQKKADPLILIFSPSFEPALTAGGPVKSLSRVGGLFNGKFNYHVLTSNRESDGRLYDSSKYEPNVSYLHTAPIKNRATVLPLVKNASILWFNSIYSLHFTFFPILIAFFGNKKTILLSPRGQWLPHALSAKKVFYLRVLKALLKISKHEIVVHYSGQSEKENSLSLFKEFPDTIFTNMLSGKKAPNSIGWKQDDMFRIGFFGLLGRMKNIEFIINMLPNLSANTVLEIYGATQNDVYYYRLKSLIDTLNLNDRVSFCGSFTRNTVSAKMESVNLVVVPSLSESFCHVFFEAIENGRLVVASNGLPWESVNKKVPNTILPLVEEVWLSRINEIKDMPESRYIDEQRLLHEYYDEVNRTAGEDTLKCFEVFLEALR